LDKLFGTVLTTGDGAIGMRVLVIGVACLAGVLFALLCRPGSRLSGSFLITLSLLPATVALVIMLVNGNIGAGVAVAGAFSLVRFRSAAGTAKEIGMIFMAMAAGLAFGMGYLACGVLFLLFSGSVLLLAAKTRVWEPKPDHRAKKLCVTLPEGTDYTHLFDDLWAAYTESCEVVKVKTVNMGSMFRVTYLIRLRDPAREKALIDEIRCRNGNLEIMTECANCAESEL